VERRTRLDILGQWGVGVETPRDRVERRGLEDLAESPVRGAPLRRRLRNFRPPVDSYVASLGGPLPYMRRLRAIEAETAEHEARLEQAWRELATAHTDDSAGFADRWRRRAQRWDFGGVNELIERHNRFYPAEARLPMDVRTRDFALVAGEPYRRSLLDAVWILRRFPPDLAAAE
jgi:hypothetical protein